MRHVYRLLCLIHPIARSQRSSGLARNSNQQVTHCAVLELPPSMSRPFVLSLLSVALAASGGDAFAVPQPASTAYSTLFAENNVPVAEGEQPTRRDVFRTMAVGMISATASGATIPSAALANIVVDTDEFGQEVEYDDEEQTGEKSEGEKE